MHYFAAIARWDGQSDAPCRPKFRALRALCREVHQLRHADHARERLQLQYEILASQTAVYPSKTPQFRSKNLRKPQQKPTSSTLVNPKKFLGPKRAGQSVQVSTAQAYTHRIDPPASVSSLWPLLPRISAPLRLCGDPPAAFLRAFCPSSELRHHPKTANLIHHREKRATFHLTTPHFGLKKYGGFNGKSPDFGAKLTSVPHH
jgi:hypothetical protein